MAKFEILSWHLPGGSEENRFSQGGRRGRDSNQASPEYKSETLPLEPSFSEKRISSGEANDVHPSNKQGGISSSVQPRILQDAVIIFLVTSGVTSEPAATSASLSIFSCLRIRLVMDYRPDGRGLIPDRGKRFSLLHSVKTGSGVHPTSYPVDTGAVSLGGGG
jgi:hypothetical protein